MVSLTLNDEGILAWDFKGIRLECHSFDLDGIHKGISLPFSLG